MKASGILTGSRVATEVFKIDSHTTEAVNFVALTYGAYRGDRAGRPALHSPHAAEAADLCHDRTVDRRSAARAGGRAGAAGATFEGAAR